MINLGPVINLFLVIRSLFSKIIWSKLFACLDFRYIVLPKNLNTTYFSSISILHFLALEVEGVLIGMLTCNGNLIGFLR